MDVLKKIFQTSGNILGFVNKQIEIGTTLFMWFLQLVSFTQGFSQHVEAQQLALFLSIHRYISFMVQPVKKRPVHSCQSMFYEKEDRCL